MRNYEVLTEASRSTSDVHGVWIGHGYGVYGADKREDGHEGHLEEFRGEVYS